VRSIHRAPAAPGAQIANILEQNHYSRRPIDKEFSPGLRSLPQRFGRAAQLFHAADIAAMQKWRSAFDDMIHSGQLDPAF